MDSSTTTSLPPSDFDISTVYDETHGVISVAVENCQLCGGARRQYYCKQCVRKGDFVHTRTSQSESERYEDKLKRWQILMRERTKLLKDVEVSLSKKIDQDKKRTKALLGKQRVHLLKNAISSAKQQLVTAQTSLESQVKGIVLMESRGQMHTEKVDLAQARLVKKKRYIQEQEQALAQCEMELGHVRRRHIDNLVTYIFPISEVLPRSESDSLTQSTVSALAEARHTAYIHGRWVYTENASEHQYRIVEPTGPTLPGSGDYSAYSMWLEENKHLQATSDPELHQSNTAHNLCAALTFTTQLVTLLAYFLNVNLPKRLCYSEFCGGEMSERHFQRAVTRLNHNVLHLCFSQNVGPELLHPNRTLHNILSLLKTSQLGRCESFMVNPDLMQSIDKLYESEGQDEPDPFEEDEPDGGDWERVPVSLPEVEPAAPGGESMFSPGHGQQRHRAGNTSTTTSIAGGLMSSAAASVASLWRWTGANKS